MALFLAFILILSLAQCGGRPSGPPPPTAPSAKVAVLKALVAPSDGSGLRITLEGGSYEISYSTAETVESAIAALIPGSRVYQANFETGTTSGNLRDADTLLLVGNIVVDTARIGEKDYLYSDIATFGKNTSAYFNYAQSPRGPPNAGESKHAKRVIVLGQILGMNFGEALGQAVREIRVLDLEPTDKEKQRYEAAVSQHNRDIERRSRMDAEGRRARPHR